MQLLWVVPGLTVPNVFAFFFVSASPSVEDVPSLSLSLQSPAFSSSAGVLRFLVSGFVRCNVGELLTLISLRSFSNCFTFLGLIGAKLMSRLQRCRTRSHLDSESWRLSPGDLFEPSFHHDECSLSPPLSTGWSTSCHGCLRDHEFYCDDRRH